MRRVSNFFHACALVAAASFAAPSSAQDAFPSRTIRIVVGTAAGGSSDVTARVLATQLQADLKQPVIVENRAGASGAIAAAFVAKAPPDGYTILFGTGSTNVIAPAMTKDIAYDPIKDFSPLVFVGRAPFVLITGRESKLRTLADVVAAARARPGQVTFGTTGPATVYEIAALTLESLANVKFNHIPYKGFVPLQVDVASGLVDVAVGPIDGFVKSDKVHVVASLGSKRAAELPNTPSAGEAGMAGFDVPVWAALWAPANTPRPVVQALHASLRKALARKDVQDSIQATGIYVEPGDEAMLRKTVEDQFEGVKALMRKNGIQPQ
ncbi:Bug family tripartite tricarboxylate transporter substrate binding protein [Ramlibacter sp.]|uniref:Bug family tripartite tricarboxylate transporter substrate binding protein n=1 Tax=Ramlibacter sp. TaxID=1917967 RepID=UPI003D0FCC0C